jgi:hypothetical protein
MAGKLMGYLIALEHSTPQALKAAVRSYLSGTVAEHDGRFIPTSAELARVVRAEQEHLNRIAPRLRIVDAGRPEPSPEQRAKMQAKLGSILKWEGHAEQNQKTLPSWQDKPLTEEVAVEPSPELVEAMRRKAWLREQELRGPSTGSGQADSETPADPQAWRFETADTHV